MIYLIQTTEIQVKTSGDGDIVNISNQVQDALSKSNAKEGYVILFLRSTTSSITIMEYENGLLTDLPRSLEHIASRKGIYEHEKAYHDGNGHSHVLSSVIGVNLSIPFKEGSLLLGTWQQIVLCEFDVRPRSRSIIIQIVSD
jgi:secondary thiamine-phosphate synthase enzyme